MSEKDFEFDFDLPPVRVYKKHDCPYPRGTSEYRKWYYSHVERYKLFAKRLIK
jgi:hypothetical protein